MKSWRCIDLKNIFKIYKRDLKDIFTNKILLVVIIGLAFLPSLYAWFNIKASWDPYGNTKNISVAVVNNDKGTIIRDKKINMGDELIEKLKPMLKEPKAKTPKAPVKTKPKSTRSCFELVILWGLIQININCKA